MRCNVRGGGGCAILNWTTVANVMGERDCTRFNFKTIFYIAQPQAEIRIRCKSFTVSKAYTRYFPCTRDLMNSKSYLTYTFDVQFVIWSHTGRCYAHSKYFAKSAELFQFDLYNCIFVNCPVCHGLIYYAQTRIKCALILRIFTGSICIITIAAIFLPLANKNFWRRISLCYRIKSGNITILKKTMKRITRWGFFALLTDCMV